MDNGIESDERNLDATHQDRSSQSIRYPRLRSPQQHGTSLHVPSMSSVDQVWRFNIKNIQPDLQIGTTSLAEIRRIGRSEVVELAIRYTQAYLDVDLSCRSTDNIVMAGHQPEMFHPGVWYKNFVLSELGKRFNCVAINLIVDNDICGNTSIRYPRVVDDDVSIATITIAKPGPNVPFEARLIEETDYFDQFQQRAQQAINGTVDDPIINRLWPQVVKSAKILAGDTPPRLGQAIAAGRHRLENEIGLKTLEVPISWVAGMESFAVFSKAIFLDLARFQNEYNRSLFEYRRDNRIRSHSHPVPQLETVEGWRESPFWVWQTAEPNRHRLFSKLIDNKVWLSDLDGWEIEMEHQSFVERFRQLNDQGVAIRPKALMTTMFSRLVLSDLFLHGIGGAKYDQLTDVIAKRFFSVNLPRFLTLTATMKLPTDVQLVGREDVVQIDQQLRELRYHPETLISSPSKEALEMMEQKQKWTVGEHRDEKSREKHLAIESLNRQLGELAGLDVDAMLESRFETLARIRASQILDSREYSYCLFPESLIDELKALAQI